MTKVSGVETKAVFARRVYLAMDEILSRFCAYQTIVDPRFRPDVHHRGLDQDAYRVSRLCQFRAPSGSITTLREENFFHNRQVVSLGDTRLL
ncbi:hypothetical protein OG203_31355 [Nocardia sp. NBC_01499]|uniref:hypothetical protein n=1 Tax=Nocardia sp. NBC_01499 TaxID=2903597 RepID=UPI003863FB56